MIKIFAFKQFEPQMPSWEIKDEIHSKLSLEVLEKIYTEAAVRFNSTVDDISQLKSRAYNLITVFISLLSVLITLFFGDYLDFQVTGKKVLIIMCFINIMYFINIGMVAYFIVQLVIIVFPSKIMLKGEEPSLIDFEGMASLSTKEQNKVYLFNSISAIQGKIEYNEAIIRNKNQRLESIIFLATFLFVFTLFFELVIKFF